MTETAVVALFASFSAAGSVVGAFVAAFNSWRV